MRGLQRRRQDLRSLRDHRLRYTEENPVRAGVAGEAAAWP